MGLILRYCIEISLTKSWGIWDGVNKALTFQFCLAYWIRRIRSKIYQQSSSPPLNKSREGAADHWNVYSQEVWHLGMANNLSRRALILVHRGIERFWIHPLESKLIPRLESGNLSRFRSIALRWLSWLANIGRIALDQTGQSHISVKGNRWRLSGPSFSQKIPNSKKFQISSFGRCPAWSKDMQTREIWWSVKSMNWFTGHQGIGRFSSSSPSG